MDASKHRSLVIDINIDFCEYCHTLTNYQHDSTHPFLCIHDSSLYPSSMTLQNVSEMIHLNTHF
jgi:hypothetical protein